MMVNVVLYSAISLLACFNVAKFLIIEGRGRIMLITVFYILSLLLFICKIDFCFGRFRKQLEMDYKGSVVQSGYVAGTYISIIIGIFQITQMAELILQTNFSAQQITREKLKKRTKLVYCSTFFLAAVYLVLLGMDIPVEINFYNCYITGEESNLPDWIFIFFSVLVIGSYIALSIGLTVSVVILLKTVNKYFKEILEAEAKKIKMIYIVFTVTYVTRTITYLIPWHSQSHVFFNDVVNYSMFAVWDILPLGLIMRYHFICFTE